jgi:tyrosinase
LLTASGQTNLFGSHRYYIWAFEKALRDECGYKGWQPYMNYQRLVDNPKQSAMFNGNATSMGGDGVYAKYRGVPMGFPAPFNNIPPADGGGCVKEGPFKDMVVSLGPVGTVVDNIPKNPQRNGLGSNPRCLRRDINKASAMGATANHTYKLITEYPEINTFYNRYLGQPYLKGDQYPWGLHNAGHYIIGGDPGGDFYASPGE